MNGIKVEEEKQEERPIDANHAVKMGGWQMPEHMVVNIPPDDRQTPTVEEFEDFGGPTGEQRPTW